MYITGGASGTFTSCSLTGGSAAVSFFVLCIVMNTCVHSLTAAVIYNNSVNDNKNVDFLMFIDSYYFFILLVPLLFLLLIIISAGGVFILLWH